MEGSHDIRATLTPIVSLSEFTDLLWDVTRITQALEACLARGTSLEVRAGL